MAKTKKLISGFFCAKPEQGIFMDRSDVQRVQFCHGREIDTNTMM